MDVVLVAFATAFVVFRVVIGVVIVTFVCCAADGTMRTNSNKNAIMPARTTLFMLINHLPIKLVQGVDITTRAALVGLRRSPVK